MQQKDKLLVFGGTVFIGKAFLDHLAATKQDYDIYCLNRGTIYWYSSTSNRDDAVRKDHPHVKHIACNRRDPALVKSILLTLNSSLGISPFNKWKAVIDFSAYYDSYLQPTTVLSNLT